METTEKVNSRQIDYYTVDAPELISRELQSLAVLVDIFTDNIGGQVRVDPRVT